MTDYETMRCCGPCPENTGKEINLEIGKGKYKQIYACSGPECMATRYAIWSVGDANCVFTCLRRKDAEHWLDCFAVSEARYEIISFCNYGGKS